MTQEEFAEYMCVTRQSVSKWETDKAYPDVEKIIKIAELYNVSLDYLVRGKENTVFEESTNDIDNNQLESVDDFNENIDISDGILNIPNSKLGLKICLGIVGVFVILSFSFIIMILVQNPWFHSNISETSAKVDKVYGQLSLVEVCYEDEAGDTDQELVFLDTSNIRQGDYISSYINKKGELFIDYGMGIIIFVVLFLILNIIAVLLLVKELIKL